MCICVVHLTESRSNPEETRLRKHLFDRENQKDDLKTIPVASVNEIMNISLEVYIIKLIDLVKRVVLIQFDSLHADCCVFPPTVKI